MTHKAFNNYVQGYMAVVHYTQSLLVCGVRINVCLN